MLRHHDFCTDVLVAMVGGTTIITLSSFLATPNTVRTEAEYPREVSSVCIFCSSIFSRCLSTCASLCVCCAVFHAICAFEKSPTMSDPSHTMASIQTPINIPCRIKFGLSFFLRWEMKDIVLSVYRNGILFIITHHLHKDILRNMYFAMGSHTFFTALLFFKQFLLSGYISSV